MTASWSAKNELFPGVWVYKNAINKELNLIERLESFISNTRIQSWQEAMVG
jgi:hypothetical protein